MLIAFKNVNLSSGVMLGTNRREAVLEFHLSNTESLKTVFFCFLLIIIVRYLKK